METAESTELDSYDVFLATSTITHIVEHTSSLGEVSFVTNTAKKVQVLHKSVQIFKQQTYVPMACNKSVASGQQTSLLYVYGQNLLSARRLHASFFYKS